MIQNQIIVLRIAKEPFDS